MLDEYNDLMGAVRLLEQLATEVWECEGISPAYDMLRHARRELVAQARQLLDFGGAE